MFYCFVFSCKINTFTIFSQCLWCVFQNKQWYYSDSYCVYVFIYITHLQSIVRGLTNGSVPGVALEGGRGRFAPCQKKWHPSRMPVVHLAPSVFVILINNTVFSAQCAVAVLWEIFTAAINKLWQGRRKSFWEGAGGQRGQEMIVRGQGRCNHILA